jgi:hypothetical protein
MMRMVLDGGKVSLFQTDARAAYARIGVNSHYEIYHSRSKGFKHYLVDEFYKKEGKVPNSDSLNSILLALEARAWNEKEYKLHNRIAFHDGDIWYDMADESWRAVRITPDGWEMVDNPPILFKRYTHQRPQVEPSHSNGDLFELMNFTNLASDDDLILLLTYIVSCFIPNIPHPILQVYGEKGAAKSTLFSLIRSIVDPSTLKWLQHSDATQLVQQLDHNWMCIFDNVSRIPEWMSDLLCRACTGESFSKRQLFSDDDDVIYTFRRCIGINGINIVNAKPDFLDRVLLIALERISPTERREESELLEAFDDVKHIILGGCFDVLSKTLKYYPTVQLKTLPRMADFARWGAAISLALGNESVNTFLDLYTANVQSQNDEVLISNPVALCIMTLMDDKQSWNGTPAALLGELEEIALKQRISTKTKTWVKAPHILTKRINEIKSNLNDKGVRVMFDKARVSGSVKRVITITNDRYGLESLLAEKNQVEDEEPKNEDTQGGLFNGNN